MTKIIAISDTHMDLWHPPKKLSELMDNADLIVHCGDFTKYEVYETLKKEYDLFAVRGNADDNRIKKELPELTRFSVEGLKIGLIHQGNYLNRFDDLGYKAKEMSVDVLVFGHIHRFVVESVGGKLLICPGSPTKPRLSIASCAEITVEGKRVNVEMKIVQDVVCGMGVRLNENPERI
ncbi:phosphoesterase, MJ0936 family [Archaeoglobus sulfaticallidus PM70-1]|uniref:Phosphoesterase n=1 Tax=Archaeoglobus sulfaticallidus PM70-1 TaxID=387631 RepID=N0BDF3_9EURY|nr:YfcE family phosphodiesterase [Archaeoglobus sulfaticallidus]AGK61018.1 phosphoesterase, MJ0936 family [Archaeoglobus sulfaticallidus PM70-1]